MTIVRNQQSLFDLISSKVDENPYSVKFEGDLFNSKRTRYYTTLSNGLKERFVPYVMTDVIGEYLNIPNSNTTINSVSLEFDIFLGVKPQADLDTNEFQYVGYTETLNSIEWLKSQLLAQYFPLGTPYLYMGSEDSLVTTTWSVGKIPNVFYFKLKPYNTDSETILTYDTSTVGHVTKNATHVRFEYSSGSYLELAYTVNTDIEFVIYHDGTNWTMKDSDGNSDTVVASNTIASNSSFTMGSFEGLVKRVAIDTDSASDFIFANVDTTLLTYDIDLKTWSTRYTTTNSGNDSTVSVTIADSLLWSEDGNAIFSIGTLNPISDRRIIDGSYVYQMFALDMEVVISNDVLFGNNFEYFLSFDSGSTYEQVYPIDRSQL